MTVTCEWVDSVDAVAPVVPDWDRMAVAAGQPYCAPAWLLSWWGHAAPPGARLRVAILRDRSRIVGVAPFYATPWKAGLWTWSLLATPVSSRIEPLTDVEHDDPVAHALAEALAAARPRAARIDLNGLPMASDWPEALRAAWPGRGRPSHHRAVPVSAPSVALRGAADLDAWLGTRSSNFRQQMRRARRRFQKDGGVFRLATTADAIAAGLEDFERLHHARWAHRGGSTALTTGMRRMLADAGRELVGSGRFLFISMTIRGRTISSQAFVAAGTEISYWNGGFDDANQFAPYKPATSTLVEAVRVSLKSGYDRFDLGPARRTTSTRFSDGQDELVWQTLIPTGPQAALAHAMFGPTRARWAAARRLTAEQKARLKRLAGRS